MTNEECRTALKRIAGYMCARKDLEALTYAMDVLEHISSELAKNSKKLENNIGELDCISRKRAIERLKLNLPISDGADNSRDRHRYMQSLADIQAIRELPSVTPQEPKTGRWIKTPKAVMGEGYMWYCDKCEHQVYQDNSKDYPSEKYCPNCGAKMVEQQESEEQDNGNDD